MIWVRPVDQMSAPIGCARCAKIEIKQPIFLEFLRASRAPCASTWTPRHPPFLVTTNGVRGLSGLGQGCCFITMAGAPMMAARERDGEEKEKRRRNALWSSELRAPESTT